MSMPLPPGSHKTMPLPPQFVTKTPVKVPPMSVPCNTGENYVNSEETHQILSSKLLPIHMEDPNIINFIKEYLGCRNASEAARNCKLTTRQGQALRSKPDIHAAIEAMTAKSVMKYGFDSNEVVGLFKDIAWADPIEMENPDGSYKNRMSLLSAAFRRAIKKFEVKNIYGEDINGMRTITGQLIKVELHDKLKTGEMLGREKDLFKQTSVLQHDVTEKMSTVLLDSAKRGEEAANNIIDVTPKVSKE